MVFDFARSTRYFLVITCVMFALTSALALRAQVRQKHAPPTGVEEICSIVFNKDVLRRHVSRTKLCLVLSKQ